MVKSVMLLGLVLVAFFAGDTLAWPVRIRNCTRWEEFHQCGTACPATCKPPSPHDVCTMQCVTGCFCKPEYVLHKGACIPREECPPQNKNSAIYPTKE